MAWHTRAFFPLLLGAILFTACGGSRAELPTVPEALADARWVARAADPPRGVSAQRQWRFGDVLVTQELRGLVASDARTGVLLWSRDINARDAVRDGAWLAVVTSDGVDVLDFDTGDTRWSFPDDPEMPYPRIALDEGVLYKLTWGRAIGVQAVDLRSGRARWTSSPIATEFWVNEVLVGQTSVLACVGSSIVLGWSRRNGERVVTLGVPGCEDFALHPGPPEEISLSEKRTAPLLFFRPEPRPDPRTIVEGTVWDVEKRPVRELRIDAGIANTRTDARGRYRIAPGVPGEVCVLAHGSDVESALTCVQPRPGETRRLDLRVGPYLEEGPRYEKQRLP